jgi:hypothetical protein
MTAVLLMALALPLGAAQPPDLKRAPLTPIERALDNCIGGTTADDPADILGSTRGLYLEGYGAVFTTEVSLVYTPGLSPFRQKVTADEVKRMHDRKQKRVPLLRQAMREMLMSAANALSSLPPREQIVVAVRFLYLPWEDTTGLPSQLVMQADRATLLKKASLDNSIHTEER